MVSEFPEPRFEVPYYAVIFSSQRTPDDDAAYDETSARMAELAATMPGYLGVESVRSPDGERPGITVSYWRDPESIAGWRREAEHLVAQRHGRERWYSAYRVRVAKVERDYH